MKTNFLLLLPLFALLASCNDHIDTPSEVAEKYWQAVQQGDTETAKEYISTNSIDALESHIKAFDNFPIDNFSIRDESSTVETIINPDSETPENNKMFHTSLVLEGDQWKIDLNNTQIPSSKTADENLEVLSDKLSDSVQDSAETIEEMVDEGMNLLNKALREGSDEMNKTMLEAMKELNERMQESIKNLKQRRQEKQNPPADTTPSDSGEGLI